jgi:hypothetical protein
MKENAFYLTVLAASLLRSPSIGEAHLSKGDLIWIEKARREMYWGIIENIRRFRNAREPATFVLRIDPSGKPARS